MGKFTNIEKLDKKEQNELFIDFAKSIASLHNSVEAANYIKDLLSESELFMLARRLQIARLLSAGLTYMQIRRTMKVSFATIAKVQTWLKLYGDGYRMVIDRCKKASPGTFEGGEWRKLKRKYPMYYWPQLLLEEIVKSANLRERRRIQTTLRQIKEKTQLTRQLQNILNQK